MEKEMKVVVESKREGTIAIYEDFTYVPGKGEYVWLNNRKHKIINIVHDLDNCTVVLVIE